MSCAGRCPIADPLAFRKGRDCWACWRAAKSPAAQPTPPPARVPLPVRRRACAHLGAKVKPTCNCTDRHCLAGRGVVQLTGACQSCPDYQPR